MSRLMVLVAALALVASPALVVPAAHAQPAPERTFDYDVRTRGDVDADIQRFADVAAATFDDPRGWSLGGSISFVRDDDGDPSFTLWLADPSEMESFSSACSQRWSCRVGDDVVINEERWTEGAPEWPLDVHEYRHYVLVHELGHWIGLDHDACPGPGEPAPTMMQESKGTQGCLARVWPLPAERNRAAQIHGVPVRFDDGFADLQWYETWKDHSVTVATSDGGSFRHRGTWIEGYGEPDLALSGDVNGDGKADLVWYEAWKDRSATVALSNGSRFLHDGVWLSDLPDPGLAALGDVDNDGMEDLVWYTGSTGEVHVARSTGEAFADLDVWIDGWGAPGWADVGDVDRDGDADLLWYEAWKDGSVTVGLSTRSSFEYAGEWISGWGAPDVAAARDADGDNRVDLLWYERWKQDGSVTVARSRGDRFAYDGTWVSGWGPPTRAGFDDVNADARADLLWYEPWKDGSVTVGVSTGERFANSGPWISGWGAPDVALFGAAS